MSLPDLWQAIDFASRIQTGQKSTDPGVLILVNQANRMKRLNTGSMDQTDHPPYRRYANFPEKQTGITDRCQIKRRRVVKS